MEGSISALISCLSERRTSLRHGAGSSQATGQQMRRGLNWSEILASDTARHQSLRVKFPTPACRRKDSGV